MSTLSDLIDMTLNVSQVSFSNDMMQQAAQRLVEEKQMKAVESCQTLIGEFHKCLETEVDTLRRMRETEQSQSSRVKRIDRAFRFFGETGNPLPFFAAQDNKAGGEMWAKTLGIKLTDQAWTIPADWKPKTEAE